MKTLTKQDFHNPEQLTRQQVGEGYRLLLPEEVDGRFGWKGNDIASFWSSEGCFERGSRVMAIYKDWAYRVPLATPLPDGTVLSSNEYCWSDEPCMSDEDHFDMMNSARISQSLPPAYLDAILDAAKKQSESLKKRTLYLAGKMSGESDFAFPVFYTAAEKLERQGWLVVNPAQLDCDVGYPLERLKALTPDEFQVFLKGAMKRDLDALQQCDAIALLPGWESSKGARAEKAVAEWLGLEVIYLPGAAQSDAVGDVGVEGLRGSIGDRGVAAPAYAPDDPKGAAGALKAPMWLLPASAMSETAWVHKHGAAKYHPYNWRDTGVCATTYISAIMRHLDQWRDGEDIDAESGRSHIAHIAASCNILMDAAHCGKLNDDRSKAP